MAYNYSQKMTVSVLYYIFSDLNLMLLLQLSLMANHPETKVFSENSGLLHAAARSRCPETPLKF